MCFLLHRNFFISFDRSSYSDDGLLYIQQWWQLFQILSIYAFLYCYKCHSMSLKQYQHHAPIAIAFGDILRDIFRIFLGYLWSGRTSGVSLVIFRTEMFHIFYRAILHNVYFDSQCNVHIKIWVHGWYTSKLLPSKCWGELSQHTCTCKLCDLMFGTNGGLYNHMARSHKRYKQ